MLLNLQSSPMPKRSTLVFLITFSLLLSSCSPRDFLTRRLTADLIAGSETFRAQQHFQFRTGIVSNQDYLSPDYLLLQHKGWISATTAPCPAPHPLLGDVRKVAAPAASVPSSAVPRAPPCPLCYILRHVALNHRAAVYAYLLPAAADAFQQCFFLRHVRFLLPFLRRDEAQT